MQKAETKKGPTKLPLGSEANDAKQSHAVHPRGKREWDEGGGVSVLQQQHVRNIKIVQAMLNVYPF